ncbi:MAG: hypothetical protein HZC17_04700 [Candidatus Omnitrophica bacterium]|nr:hypothetical protein [Candidatus Omnitrophota bacterium]
MIRIGNLLFVLMFCLWGSGIQGYASEKQINNGQDLTRPLTRVDQRYMIQALSDAGHTNTFTARADAPFRLSKTWMLGTRIDVPAVLGNAKASDNLDKNYQYGLGDLLTQVLLIKEFNDRWAAGGGAQFIFPTASKNQMGQGKYQIVPSFGLRRSLPKISNGSFFVAGLRYDVDYAGNDKRGHINQMELSPTLNIMFPHDWFFTSYPSTDIRINFNRSGTNTGTLFLPFNAMIGKMITKKCVATVEFGFPMIHDFEVYDFKMEARVGFFF